MNLNTCAAMTKRATQSTYSLVLPVIFLCSFSILQLHSTKTEQNKIEYILLLAPLNKGANTHILKYAKCIITGPI